MTEIPGWLSTEIRNFRGFKPRNKLPEAPFQGAFFMLEKNESEYKLVMWTFYIITGIK